MRSFASPAAFALFAAGLAERADRERRSALDEAARVVQAEAKREIGDYQPAAPPFGAWPQLAESTQKDRVAQGFTANDPLLRTGKLRDSIGRRVGDGEAVVGSDLDVALYQELGTKTIPPRSFLGGAAVRKSDEVVKILGRRMVAALRGDTGTKIPISGGED
ncbi:HK97 gp10 family phage protein [Roseomonas chloroacetimidivorans]|uniref:HK97 gp10 family phage protein n=1 Tax=Roseomonas chloroacetimidivorans TaxID=1766656 RepID=UPI003C72D406